MKKIFSHPWVAKSITLAKAHKIVSTIIVVVLLFGGYFAIGAVQSDVTETRYITDEVSRNTLISSIAGVGQVSVSEQLEVQPKISGDVVRVYVSKGQEVSAGTLIAALDAQDAERSVRNAETDLETAKLELDRMLEPVDELTLLQAENSLTQAKNSKQKFEDDFEKAYEDGFNTVSNAFLDLPGLMTGIDDIFFDEGDFQAYQWNIDWYSGKVDEDNRYKAEQYEDDVREVYNKARVAYTKNFDNYKATSRTSDRQTIEALIDETYETTRLISEMIKNSNNFLDFVQDDMEYYDRDIPALMSTHQSNIDSYTATANGNLSSLLSIKNTIKNAREAIVDAETTITERELSLAKTKEGAGEFDIRAKNITIQQKEDALITAQQNLANHYVRAPFGGTIASVDVDRGKSISSGTTIATLLTNQQIVEIALNEIDIVKVKEGQKATILFDAIEDLTVTGEVVSVDSLATVSQGVVSYDVTIAFDIADDRIKPGMSASVSVITEAKQDILVVPNSAIQYQGANTSVQVMNTNGAPAQRQVVVGLSNDTHTEIVSGLDEGDVIVTQTINAGVTSATQPSNTNSIIPGGRGFGGGGGNVRFQTR